MKSDQCFCGLAVLGGVAASLVSAGCGGARSAPEGVEVESAGASQAARAEAEPEASPNDIDAGSGTSSRASDEGAPPERGGAADIESSPFPYAAFPPDSELLWGVSFDALTDSALWAEYGYLVVKSVDPTGQLERTQKACGFSPLSEIRSVTLGGSVGPEDELVAVVEGASRSQIRGCLEGRAKIDGTEVAVTEHGRLLHYEIGASGFWVGWLDDRSFVVSLSGNSGDEVLERRVEGQGGLSHDAELIELIDQRVERDAGFWLAMLPSEGSSLAQELAAGGGFRPEAIYVSAAATHLLRVAAGVKLQSGDKAAQLLDQAIEMLAVFGAEMEGLGPLVSKIELSREGEHLLANLELTADDLDQLIDELAAMLRGGQ